MEHRQYEVQREEAQLESDLWLSGRAMVGKAKPPDRARPETVSVRQIVIHVEADRGWNALRDMNKCPYLGSDDSVGRPYMGHVCRIICEIVLRLVA